MFGQWEIYTNVIFVEFMVSMYWIIFTLVVLIHFFDEVEIRKLERLQRENTGADER